MTAQKKISEFTENPYPEIGSQVTYLKQFQGEGGSIMVREGTGTLLGIHIDPMKRLMCHIEDKSLPDNMKIFNTDFGLVNYGPDMPAKYEAFLQDVQDTAAAANAQIKEITETNNNRVDELLSGLLGPPINFE